MALGFLQLHGVDYFETYAAVASINSIRMLLSTCCASGYIIGQLDVDTAYLNAEIKEKVYLEVPKGLKMGSKFVLKLNRALYGLKQAANAWNTTIHNALIKMEFQACGADRCIYKKKDRDGWIYVCLYVDNMIVAAKSTTMVNNVKRQISQRLQSKDLGSVKYLLGMEINYDHKKREMSITQQKYLKLTAEHFKQSQARVTENPCDPSLKLPGEDSPKTPEEKEIMKRTPYRLSPAHWSTAICCNFHKTRCGVCCKPTWTICIRPRSTALEGSNQGAALPEFNNNIWNTLQSQ